MHKMEDDPSRSTIRSLHDKISPRHKKPLLYLPSAVTLLRLASAPLLVFLIDAGHVITADSLFLLAIFSDLADGYLARKLGASSQFGEIIDVGVDFAFVGGLFLYFTVEGIYPACVLIIIAAMFAQFLVTSTFTKVVFDPVGKYYGSLLYGAIGLTMLFSDQIAREIIVVAFIGLTCASLSSRIRYYLESRK